ncbi:MAG TPA: radical SAM protein [Thermoanaerobaculia bacterium]|nr:radical SAM protein [Thermoanaerobaculia bacterium]
MLPTVHDSSPRSPSAHLAQGALFLPNGSRVFDVDEETYAALDALLDSGDEAAIQQRLRDLGVDVPPLIDDAPVQSPPLRALSLAVAQKCNLGCTYCYAQQGEFGGAAKNMPLDVAFRAVDLLFSEASSGDRVNLSFLGGEPLINRDVIRQATERAVRVAEERGVVATFSITTNGTLLTPDDGAFFEQHAFAVTISIDGIREAHDIQRAFRNGSGSFARIIANAAPLLAMQRQMQVSARVTVTPRNLALRETLDSLLALGFHSVGFSPMLASPTGNGEMHDEALGEMLAQMVGCGQELERRIIAGDRYPFANAVNALREIHKGTHRPYPCGAGAGYLGVSADGDLAACHRFVGDDAGAMGAVDAIDRTKQNAWLADRHVHRQEPCRSCWARYLCGGGCHHEVLARGRTACDYVRGWLHYCIGAYSRLIAARPEWFGE